MLMGSEDFFFNLELLLANDPLNVSLKKLSFFDPPYNKGSPSLFLQIHQRYECVALSVLNTCYSFAALTIRWFVFLVHSNAISVV